jgi:subtilisin-like proprotein convertase family protein
LGKRLVRLVSAALAGLAPAVFCANAAGLNYTTYSNPTPVVIPASGTGPGFANPAPSIISVSGLPNVQPSNVRVTLHSLFHDYPYDVEIVLQGPSGATGLLMVERCGGGGAKFTGQTFTFDDAAGQLPKLGPCASGTYFSSYSGGDPFPPPPAPEPRTAGHIFELSSPPNGDWGLWIYDDTGGQSGLLAGGWSLDIAPRAGCNTKVTDKAIVGTPGTDRLIGTRGADIMVGLGGDDLIKGLGGNDKICGSDGVDTLKGGKGSDRLYGEGGKDSLRGQAGKDSCSGGKGRDAARSCEKQRSI